MHTFIEGLEPNTKILLDSIDGGQALENTYDELYTLLNRISRENQVWNADVSGSTTKKAASLLEVDQLTAITAHIASLQNQMNTQFSNLNLGPQQSPMNLVQQTQTWCEVCGNGDHSADACSANPESVNFVGNAQRQGNQNFGNTYNPVWLNHPISHGVEIKGRMSIGIGIKWEIKIFNNRLGVVILILSPAILRSC